MPDLQNAESLEERARQLAEAADAVESEAKASETDRVEFLHEVAGPLTRLRRLLNLSNEEFDVLTTRRGPTAT